MLHVTNGDSVSLRESGVEGDVLVWGAIVVYKVLHGLV